MASSCSFFSLSSLSGIRMKYIDNQNFNKMNDVFINIIEYQ